MTEASPPTLPAGIRSGRSVAIDLLRGVAALSVVYFHAANFTPFLGTPQTPEWLGRAFAFVLTHMLGRVELFFVISGFCVHLKWARDRAEGREGRLDGRRFFQRRVRRLYPAYLAALVVYVAMLWLVGRFGTSPFDWYDLGLHLALVHNFDARTSYSLNNVLWSLAVEAQLYALYFVLVPLRLRLGWTRTLALCLAARIGWFALSFGVHRVFHIEFPASEATASHWFTWALGAWAVECWFGLEKLPRWARDLRLASLLLGAAVVLTYFDRRADPSGWFHRAMWLGLDVVWGVGFLIVMNRVLETEVRGTLGNGRWVRALAGVGVFSYSLYLMHELLFKHIAPSVYGMLGVPSNLGPLMNVLIAAPLTLPVAWVFCRMFELPFMKAAPPRAAAG